MNYNFQYTGHEVLDGGTKTMYRFDCPDTGARLYQPTMAQPDATFDAPAPQLVAGLPDVAPPVDDLQTQEQTDTQAEQDVEEKPGVVVQEESWEGA